MPISAHRVSVALAAPAEMQRGEPSSSEPALPRATAPVDVALASDDAHLACPGVAALLVARFGL